MLSGYLLADTDGAGLTTTTSATNIDIVVARNVRACAEAQSNVVIASRVDIERIQTEGRVEVAVRIA